MSELLRPFTTLLISPEVPMRQAILAGDKTVTLRLGHRDYQRGDKLMLCCHLDPWAVMTTVVSVRHTSLAEVGQLDWEAEGFDSHQEMVEGIERYYGPMIPQQNITILRWGALEGQLTEPPTEDAEAPTRQAIQASLEPNMEAAKCMSELGMSTEPPTEEPEVVAPEGSKEEA